MPYNKTTMKNYGESPFEMKAKKYGNSPMQKNFGGDLAINKKLDKDSMAGGLTGQPSGETGKLGSGPMMYKFNSPAAKAKRAKFKSDVKSFGKGLFGGLKELGSQVKSGITKMGSNIREGKPLVTGTFAGKDGGKLKKASNAKFKKANTKKSTKTSLNLLPKDYKLGDLSKKSTTSIPKITVPKKTKNKTKTTYKQAWDGMTETRSGTRTDKYGNIYKNTKKGFERFKKAASDYNKKNKK